MKVLIAMDSFKGSLSSLEAAESVEKGIKKVYTGASIYKLGVADGGEGTTQAVVDCLGGRYISREVAGPLGERITARYGIVNEDTAIIEMAEASGLCLIPEGRRNPFITSTYGTGELILDAMDKNCSKIIIGIGGSATNDGGAGMAMAMGARLLNARGTSIGTGGGALGELECIDIGGLDARLKQTQIMAACDVSNPLCGENGASKVFGPQKGATPDMVERLDKNLYHFSEIIKRDLHMEICNTPGAGAAGGLGGGLMAFCGAKQYKGVDLILDILRIDNMIENSDIVITGEGRIDGQTVYGKVPVGVAARAQKHNRPVFAIAGFLDKGAELVYEHGIDSVASAMAGPMSVQEAMAQAPKLVEEASERLFRVIRAMRPEL